jgi:hypothetical protein
MTAKIHFENLTLGMKAKLGPSYRTNNNSIHNVRKFYRNYPSSLGDMVGKHRLPRVSRKN